MTIHPKPTASPTPSPIPNQAPLADRTTGASGSEKPHKPAPFEQPKLRLELRDITHPATSKFLNAVDITAIFPTAVSKVQRLLYQSPSDPSTNVPPTRSVTLVLRDMDGVAYTTGLDLDYDHKEIHFSLDYIDRISPPSRLAAEITGVLTHELVHCYQWRALGTCPGGLIEGIADWVRLNCDLSPPHWKRDLDGDWDRGYQHTAYFLQYLETRFGEGTVRRINEKLRLCEYEAKPFWTELLGRPVEQLYGDYTAAEGKGESQNHMVDDSTQT
ncbi:peptidase of plants and bacteria-domain-containing protein [Echria macrotheca]|uniref:Peptidase of plants and bacteria-domain-containing protein n=1 Tax=Echria macrotheca TaxID=438768 RepID=A0AAJ0F8N1_9PEZI|nr:peptidase of plants and bacteria-domain-containing protein [Echria macrotheca]